MAWSSLRVGIMACCGLGCSGRLVDVDSASDSSDADDDDDDDDSAGDEAVSISPTAPADTGTSVDAGVFNPASVTLCPVADAQDVGVDTRTRIAFSSDATPVLVDADPIRLTCDGSAVAGSTTAGAGQLVFVPTATLPADGVCGIELEPGAVTLDDIPVAGQSWTFSTGSALGLEYEFAAPETLAVLGGYHSGTVEAEGDDVVVSWVGEFPMLARSNDRGDHFEISSLQPDRYGSGFVQTHLENGVVHAAWLQQSWSGGPGIFYSRSEPGLGPMSEPLRLDDDDPETFSNTPTITSDGGEIVVVGWFQTCNAEPCGLPGPGLYTRRSDDGGLSFGEIVEASSGWTSLPSAGPLFAWVDGGIVAAWNPDPFAYEGISVLDGEAGFTSFAQFDFTMGHVLARAGDDEAVLFWYERLEIGAPFTTANLVRIRSRSADGVESPRVVAQSATGLLVAMDLEGDVLAGVVAEGDFFDDDPTARKVLLSLDGGDTYLSPQPLDIMVDAEDDMWPDDSFVPSVAVADADRIHLNWLRKTAEQTTELVYAHGDRIEPCGLLSR